MSALWTMFALILRDQRRAMVRGAVLSLVVLVMGAALLGLSGWFITAAAAAGLAGLGAVFDVFRPSAMVRFLALGRAAARYGERLLTHDATLRALAGLRVRVLRRLSAGSIERLLRLRGAQTLNRLTADVDALDGVPLRLILPLAAGVLTHLLAFGVLWWLVDLRIAALVAAGFLIGAAAVIWWVARRAHTASRREETAAQAVRVRLIDMIATRDDLAVYGRLDHQHTRAKDADARRASERAALDRVERRAGFALSLGTTVLAGAVLGLGIVLVRAGDLTPARAAIGFFATLALAETVLPLRRASADMGRMAQATRRVLRLLGPDLNAAPAVDVKPNTKPSDAQPKPGAGPALQLQGLRYQRAGSADVALDHCDLEVSSGEWVALCGPSGSGKTTALLLAAGLLPVQDGAVHLLGHPLADWPDTGLRDAVTLVPQRTRLLADTIRDNLLVGAPDATDDDLFQALGAVHLDHVVLDVGGLDQRLTQGGVGLSGGEARRLALARAILRAPPVLLLDEPTEGLDRATADIVLGGIRRALPGTAVLMASHRSAEIEIADRIVTLG